MQGVITTPIPPTTDVRKTRQTDCQPAFAHGQPPRVLTTRDVARTVARYRVPTETSPRHGPAWQRRPRRSRPSAAFPTAASGDSPRRCGRSRVAGRSAATCSDSQRSAASPNRSRGLGCTRSPLPRRPEIVSRSARGSDSALHDLPALLARRVAVADLQLAIGVADRCSAPRAHRRGAATVVAIRTPRPARFGVRRRA